MYFIGWFIRKEMIGIPQSTPFALSLLRTFKRFWQLSSLVLLFVFVLINPVCGQDHTILFGVTAPGVPAAITNWGLDTTWVNSDNMKRGLIFMGSNNVHVVRVGFVANEPLTNNDISPDQKATLQSMANLAAMAGTNAMWDMSSATGAGVAPWYQSGAGTVYPDRWAAAMEACQRYYNHPMWMVEPFNEPDYGWGQGSQQNLYDIMGDLQASTNFPGTAMAGGSTLNCDQANAWYNAIASRASLGTTHCLAGSVSSYVSFIQNVLANGDTPFSPEAHNLVETIIGANNGLGGVTWWGTAELARGDFVIACQGQRLGYADDWANWTAAAVYRGTNGAVQAFLGGSERMAVTTSYRFFSRDRDVFYDGYGPRRDYTVTVPGGTGYGQNQPNMERVVNITWGSDVQPPISGRYLVVNRNNGLVLQVPGASTNPGQALSVGLYTGASNQLWDIYPLPNTFGGDVSYFSITAAHDGLNADESNFSYNDGNPIEQWNGGTNVVEQWYFQYAGNGCFHIRSRWSNKCIGVSLVSVEQVSYSTNSNELWRLIPVGNAVPAGKAISFTAPPAPTNLNATANPVSVQLNWTAGSDMTYTVLRSTNSGGPYDIIARGLTNNVFTDGSANQAQTCYYVVSAVDELLNQSPYSSQAGATPTLAPALVARYHFENNTTDSSGNANDAEAVGAPGYALGVYGSALSLSGTSQYVMAPAGIMAGVTNFTIAAWAYWNGGAAWQRIFDFGNDTTQYMFLTPGSGSGTLRFAISTNGNAPGAEQIVETSPLPVSRWTHVAVTYDGSTARLYTNGVLAASGSVTLSPADFNPALNNFGASQYPADPLFNGRLDEVYIYNYALSSTEITRLMNNQPPPPTTPTVISAVESGAALTLSWPSNYIGSRLLMQTNHLSGGISLNTNDWGTIAQSQQTNQMILPIDPDLPAEFFRLIYP